MKVMHLMAAGHVGGIEVLMNNYSRYSIHQNIFVFFRDGGQIAEQMLRANQKVIVMNTKTHQMLKAYVRLLRICFQEKVDVVVTHHEDPLIRIFVLLIKLFCPGVKTCSYKHAGFEAIQGKKILTLSAIRGKLKMEMIRLGFCCSDGVIAISGFVKQTIIEQIGIASDKITVIYNGVPCSEFETQRPEKSSSVKLIYVGRLERVKGVHKIIPALYELRKHYDVSLDIVGDGAYRATLEEMVQSYGLNDFVRFHGMQKNVSAYLAEADVFIHMPVWEEGFGITIIEAMAAGCICVCAAKGGIPEIIRDGVDGYLVKSSTSEELASILKEVVSKMECNEHTGMCQNAVLRSEFFSIRKYSKQLDEYLLGLKK